MISRARWSALNARKALGAALLAVATLALTAPLAVAEARTKARSWLRTTVATAEGGIRIGNPAAATRLIEYSSYTCPHCARFVTDSKAELEDKMIFGGTISLEVRALVRDPVDLTAAMLSRCGGPARFLGNHHLLFARQSEWLARAAALSGETRQAWMALPMAQRPAQIARDVGLDTLMRSRGFTPVQIKACLADPKAQAAVIKTTAHARDTLALPGTPSFLINGTLADQVFSWDTLKPLLPAR